MIHILVAAALAMSPSQGGGSDGVACVIDQASAADVAWIGDQVLAGRDIGSGDVADRMTGHVAACIERFGWDEAQAVRVSTLSVNAMVRTVALQRLAAAGIDRAALDRWFDAQSETFRTRAFIDMNENEAGAVLETLAPDTLSLDVFERNSGLVGGYLASRVILLRGERGLPLE